MGVAEAAFQVEISATWAPLTFFLLLIAILLVRPQGLFGATVRGAV
jgi:branched-chain amino acid transport system permease protein